MNAAQIAHALGDARREGRTRCRCPLRGLRRTSAIKNYLGLGTIWDRRSLVQAKIFRRTHELADDTIQLGATRHA